MLGYLGTAVVTYLVIGTAYASAYLVHIDHQQDKPLVVMVRAVILMIGYPYIWYRLCRNTKKNINHTIHL